MPPELKQEIRWLLKQRNKAKANKVADIEEIQVEMWDTMGGMHRQIIDEDDNGDVHMYLVDIHPDEQHAY